MRISVGILAYNESASIGKTLSSLMEQSYLSALPPHVTSFEVVCVPNGCTDDTAAVARRTMDAFRPRRPDPRLTFRVVELAQGGKANAWNEFVHRIGDQAADVVILMDGDIRVHHVDTVANLVGLLESKPDVMISVPRILKHIELRPTTTFWELMSLKLGELTRARPFGLAGCMYCARGEVLRRVWFPAGLVGEDAFLHGQVVTDLCRSKERFERIERAENTAVVFEAYTRPAKMYRVLRRQAVTAAVNGILWHYLWTHVGELDSGALIKARSDQDPDWFKKLIREEVARRGWWAMPDGILLRRVAYLGFLKPSRRVLLLPWALAGMCVDFVVNVDANRLLKSGRIDSLWEPTHTTQI